jgi:hypothetical protein
MGSGRVGKGLFSYFLGGKNNFAGTPWSERAFDPPWYLPTEGQGRVVESRAEQYRRLARECMTLASTSVSEPGRSTLIEMARVWSRLADEQAQQQVQPRNEDEE